MGYAPIWVQELGIDLTILFINLLYILMVLCIIGWVGNLLIKFVKYLIPQQRSEANILGYIQNTINIYTILGSISLIAILIWFNYPQPILPKHISTNRIGNTYIRIDAYTNNELAKYDGMEIKIDTQEKWNHLIKLLNQYTCKRSSESSSPISLNLGHIEIRAYIINKQGQYRPLYITVTPGNEKQNRRYESANTNFIYLIQQDNNQSLSQDLIDYIDALLSNEDSLKFLSSY